MRWQHFPTRIVTPEKMVVRDVAEEMQIPQARISGICPATLR